MRSLPVSNIVNSFLLPESKNILYDHHQSVFDLIIKSIDAPIIDLESAHADMWYNLLLTNSPIEYSNNNINIAKSSHINSVVFFHDNVPPQIKREDVLILHQQLSNCTKVVTESSLLAQWLPQDENWLTIEYGIPYIEPLSEDKTIDFVLFNFKNNQNIINVYNQLKSDCPNSMIINELPETIEELYNILDKVKVCIDFDNRINSLVAASRGCFNITSYHNGLIEYYEQIESISKLGELLNNCLYQIDNNLISKQTEFIKQRFPFEIFAKNINDTMVSVSKEAFLL